MEEGILLTDDEVVALSALDGAPWPIGLSTVAGDVAGVRAAALRGVRSLAVRGLLGSGDSHSPRIVDELASAVRAFLHSRKRVGAYVARISAPESMAGASITAAIEGADWWTEASTSDGIHAIRRTTAAEAHSAIVEFADGIRSAALLSAAPDPSEFGCVIRWGSGEGQSLMIQSGCERWDQSVLDSLFIQEGP